MKKIIITEKQLEDIASTKLINCNSYVNALYKYMTVSRVIEMLENKSHCLGFVSPEKWYDPYETKFLNTDYSIFNNYKQPRIYCLCARMDNLNEEASWKIYKKGDEPLLRMSINTNELLLSIKDFAVKHRCNVYFSKVDYRLKRKEIDNLHLPSSPYYHEFFDNFNTEQYIKIMSLKRMAFSYESEYRIFIVPTDNTLISKHVKDNVLFVPINLKMIKRFTFNPANKLNDNLESKLYYAKYKAEFNYIKNKIKSLYPDATIYKSTLYSSVKKIEKI